MLNLQIRFVRQSEIEPQLQHEINEVDRLAFRSDSSEDTGEASDADKFEILWQDIRWGPPEWVALGCVNDELVTTLCLLRREILVGTEQLWVVGVGSVATHPAWQKRGLSTRLLQASESFMHETLSADFGLLICGEDRVSFYARVGWKHVADTLFFWQDEKRYPIVQIPVMILPLSQWAWPMGEIDLCGSPW